MLRGYLHRVDLQIVRPLLKSTVVDLAAMQRGFEILAEWSSADRLGQIPTPTFHRERMPRHG